MGVVCNKKETSQENGGEVMPPKNLKGWRAVIKEEAPFVGVKPYSHNIISVALNAIAESYGDWVVNEAIVDFGLEKLGWVQRN